jgi:uncharacterized protein YhaN
MRIARLQLKNFRKFKNLDLHFDSKFNVVVGPNEQGKSTLVHALIAGLFFDPLKKPKADILAHQAWGSEELYAINLEFEAEGETYALTKDFQNKYLLLRDSKGKKWQTFPEVTKKMEELSGLSSATLYESSACIYQDKVSELHSSKAELAKVLQELVTSEGQDTNVLTLVRTLNREVQKMKKGHDRDIGDPGILRSLMNDLEDRKTRFADLSSRSSTIVARQSQIAKAKKEFSEMYSRKQVLENVLSKSSEAKNLQQELASVISEFDKVQKILVEVELLERKLEETREKQTKTSASDVATLRADIQKLFELNAVLQAHEKDLSKKQVSESYTSSERKLDVVFYALAGISLLVGVIGFFATHLLLIGFGAAAIFVALGFTEGSRKKQVTVDVSGREKEKLDEVGRLNLEMKSILARLKVGSTSEAQKLLEDLEQLDLSFREIKAKLDALQSQNPKEKLLTSREDLAVKKIGLEKMARDLNIEEKDLMKIAEMEQEFERVSGDLQKTQEDIRAHEAVIESLGFDESEFEELKQEIKDLESEQNKIQSRIFIYEKIRDTLQVAQNQTMSSVKDVLQKTISEYLPQITDGRYEQVRVSETLEVEVFSKERGDFVNPRESLSQGTIDQIYLVARFALAKAQSEGKFPPLILDDPFVTFDVTRKTNTAKLIQKLTEDFQVFLFTYSDEYNQHADKVIGLHNYE